MKRPGISLFFLAKAAAEFHCGALETLLQYTPETRSLWRTITLN